MTTRNALLLTALALVAIPASVIAQPTAVDAPLQPKVFHATKEEAMRAAGLDVYVTQENVSRLKAFAENKQSIQAAAGNSYAGTWIEYGKNFKAYQVIATTAPISTLKKVSIKGPVQFVRVKFSYQELLAMQETIRMAFSESAPSGNPWICSVALDEKQNKLLVRGSKENQHIIHARLALLGIDRKAIVLEIQNGLTLMSMPPQSISC
jgi:hypothetical protein